jgi:hypothetical protein
MGSPMICQACGSGPKAAEGWSPSVFFDIFTARWRCRVEPRPDRGGAEAFPSYRRLPSLPCRGFPNPQTVRQPGAPAPRTSPPVGNPAVRPPKLPARCSPPNRPAVRFLAFWILECGILPPAPPGGLTKTRADTQKNATDRKGSINFFKFPVFPHPFRRPCNLLRITAS